MIAPVLTTDCLVLRDIEAADWPAFQEHFASNRSSMIGDPLAERPAWNVFAANVGHWVLHGFGIWTITLKDDMRVGHIGCCYPETWPEKELGWLIWATYESKVYAFEAAQAARAHALSSLVWTKAVSYIDHANTRSNVLAERLCAVLDPNAANPGGKPCHVYHHPRPEAHA